MLAQQGGAFISMTDCSLVSVFLCLAYFVCWFAADRHLPIICSNICGSLTLNLENGYNLQDATFITLVSCVMGCWKYKIVDILIHYLLFYVQVSISNIFYVQKSRCVPMVTSRWSFYQTTPFLSSVRPTQRLFKNSVHIRSPVTVKWSFWIIRRY